MRKKKKNLGGENALWTDTDTLTDLNDGQGEKKENDIAMPGKVSSVTGKVFSLNHN